MVAPRPARLPAFAVFAGVGVVSLLAAALMSSTPPSAPTQPPEGTAPPPPAQPPAPAVAIVNFSFAPANLTVKVGTTVNWTNLDAIEHTVTVGGHASGHHGAIDSGLLAQNQTFSYTFDTPGTYAYHCDPHPFMVANITVTL